MFKKTAESVRNARVFQKSLAFKMGYSDTNVVYAKKYFNLKEDWVLS